MNVHFRIVLPAEFKGRKHVANAAKIYMKVDDREEMELTELMPVKSFESAWYPDEVTTLRLELIGSVEVSYGD